MVGLPAPRARRPPVVFIPFLLNGLLSPVVGPLARGVRSPACTFFLQTVGSPQTLGGQQAKDTDGRTYAPPVTWGP